MSHVNALRPGGDLPPLVEKLGRHADLDRDGKLTPAEFAGFLDRVLHPEGAPPAAASLPRVPAYLDRLVGFGPGATPDTAHLLKHRVAALAQHLEPTPAHLGRIAAELGPQAGVMTADGLTFLLAGGQGAVGVRPGGSGDVWQFLGPGTAGTTSAPVRR
jgi:hypothetical protein